MKKRLLLVVLAVSMAGSSAYAVGLGSISLGFHLIPAVEKGDDPRLWDLSLSFEIALDVGDGSSISLLTMVDSKPTTLGTSIEYDVHVSGSFDMGGGLTILWPFDSNEHLLAPLVEMSARAAAHGMFFSAVDGEAALSFPVLTLAREQDQWSLIPLAQFPSLALSGEFTIAEHAALSGRVTLQPVVTDTALLENPIGKIADHLLILPMGSAFIRYIP
jgi:hypothetical protein